MAMAPPPRDRRGMRTGFTTGACTAAAAKAATRMLVRGGEPELMSTIETTLPNRQRVTFPLARVERGPERVVVGIIKDAGDDPDCTHGAELVAEVELTTRAGIELRGGDGVATVTRPGLGLDVGGPAINPVPRRNITEMVSEELVGSAWGGAIVTVHVPRGVELATQTTNARLGLIGGISILGTTGIVQPYSTAAWKASVVQEIDVAVAAGARVLVLATGGKSEQYAMALHPELPEHAFVQVGDFIGVGIRQCARRGVDRAVVVGMIGKLSKMAAGKVQTHVAGSEVDLPFLASVAGEVGADAALCDAIRGANTARHVLELSRAAGLDGLPARICARVVDTCRRHAGGALDVHVAMVDFGGALLGHCPQGVP